MKKHIALVLLSWAAVNAFAGVAEFTLTLKNHAFEPRDLKVPAGQKFKILVVNEDASPAEFECKPLGREKVIPGKTKVILNFEPLKPGRYGFVEEYHETEAAAQGAIIAE